ncbi:GTP cyclohydrolase II [Kordiimonas sediminis]|uniref:GTP cyclohydrolase II n=1 Tax=Kordiimonas sediminis TaxID=1735581 RepID=UPI001E63188B|nr:GTP cyclohydrolase II [Kordiimonas sediminis]
MADDLRRGWPAAVQSGDTHLVFMPLEFAARDMLAQFDAFGETSRAAPFIIVTGRRAETLKVAHKGWSVVRLRREGWMRAVDFEALADPTRDLATPLKGPYSRIDHEESPVDQAAVKLVKIARLLPAVLAFETDTVPDGMLSVSATDVLGFDEIQAQSLRQVASAKVPLAGAENTRLVSFRPLTGGIEHMAIVIGDPPRHEPVLVRLHSECFTGDLLGSLKCDCGEQLRGAIKAIDENGGGVVLYLAQEGRGIGLTSKLKAYALQDEGFDTVDANTRLGFEVDERDFGPAAEMLKALGIEQVKLMTNNPNKVEGLKARGINVVERVKHAFPTNPHNIGYLQTKKDKTGHLL